MDQVQICNSWSGKPGLSHGARPQSEVPVAMDPVIEDLQSPALGGLLGYWQSKRVNAKPIPSRSDLDPVEMAPEILPLVTLVDVEAGTRRLRFRLVGTRVARDLGSDETGQYLDQLSGGSELGERLAALFGSVASRGRPQRLSGYLLNHRGRQIAFEALALPLSSEGTAVNMILGGLESTPLR